MYRPEFTSHASAKACTTGVEALGGCLRGLQLGKVFDARQMLTRTLVIRRAIRSLYNGEIFKVGPHTQLGIPGLCLERDQLVPVVQVLALSWMIGFCVAGGDDALIDTEIAVAVLGRNPNKTQEPSIMVLLFAAGLVADPDVLLITPLLSVGLCFLRERLLVLDLWSVDPEKPNTSLISQCECISVVDISNSMSLRPGWQRRVDRTPLAGSDRDWRGSSGGGGGARRRLGQLGEHRLDDGLGCR